MLSFLRNCVIPAVVAAGLVTVTTIPMAPADGKFTIKDVPVGEYALMARVDGKGMARERVTGKPDDSVTVSLKLADRPARGAGQGGGNRPNRNGNANGQ